MRDYVIVTDSCCDLSAEMVEELEIQVQPLSFVMDDKEYFNYPDNRDIHPKDFYDKLRAGSLGTTSAVSVGAFHEVMTEIVKTGKDVLYIGFSGALSTTCQSAVIAAEEVMEENPGCTVNVVDSLCASLGQGMLVYLTVQQKRKGASLAEATAFAEQQKRELHEWFTVDDLHHLKRGGRVSAATAILGSVIQIKPILKVDEGGHLVNVDKVRGRKASIRALADKIEELVGQPGTVFISHGDCLDEAEALAEIIKKKYGVEDIVINYVGPVIGNHTGPGVIALFFVGK